MQVKSILDCIGNTPLVKLPWFSSQVGTNVYAKLEYLNPGLSIKDRMVLEIVKKGMADGKVNSETVLIDGSSGNTGASIAMVAAALGLKAIIVMPEKVSPEKIDTVRAFGAEVVMTTTETDPESPNYYPNVAKRIVEGTPNAFYVNQYHNIANTDAHYATTGPEIWGQSEGELDLFVCGIGTGGTVTGVGKFLKEKKPSVHVLAIDVEGSIYTDFFYKGITIEAQAYKVEGIGEDFIPPIVDFKVIDDMVMVGDKDSFLMAREIARNEGLLLGGSSGSAFVGLQRFLEEKPGRFHEVVVLCPDSGVKYLSKAYNDKWMRDNEFM